MRRGQGTPSAVSASCPPEPPWGKRGQASLWDTEELPHQGGWWIWATSDDRGRPSTHRPRLSTLPSDHRPARHHSHEAAAQVTPNWPFFGQRVD